MNSITVRRSTTSSEIGPAFTTALIIILYLFYTDEGYYDFRWMKDAGNWFMFFIYFIFTFTIMWMISHFLFGRLTGLTKWAAVMGSGFTIMLVAIFMLFR